MTINVHSNYYYMVEGSPHVWLTCMVITAIWWRGALTCGSHVAINMHSKLPLYGGGEPSCVAHMWQLTCMVITNYCMI